MAITHESITTPGKEIDDKITAIQSQIASLRSLRTTPAASTTQTVQSWVWDCLGRWGLTTSSSVVRTRSAGTILGWQIATPSSLVPTTGIATVDLRVDGVTVDTIVWDLSTGPSARSDDEIAYTSDQEIVPWVVDISGLGDGEEIVDVSIEVWRSDQ